MTKEKQVEEMAKDIEQARIKAIDTTNSMNYGFGGWYSKELYNAGYRKIHDDYQRQCTCYALGCQMAEELKKDVAREIFEELEKIAMHNVTSSYGLWLMSMGEAAFAELKKRYTEEKQ